MWLTLCASCVPSAHLSPSSSVLLLFLLLLLPSSFLLTPPLFFLLFPFWVGNWWVTGLFFFFFLEAYSGPSLYSVFNCISQYLVQEIPGTWLVLSIKIQNTWISIWVLLLCHLKFNSITIGRVQYTLLSIRLLFRRNAFSFENIIMRILLFSFCLAWCRFAEKCQWLIIITSLWQRRAGKIWMHI